jgi:hypothetical protein
MKAAGINNLDGYQAIDCAEGWRDSQSPGVDAPTLRTLLS